MPSRRRNPLLLLVPVLPLAMAAVTWLAVVAFRQSLAAGAAEAWLGAWALVFVVALPVSMPLMALARWWQGRARRTDIAPLTGWKIP